MTVIRNLADLKNVLSEVKTPVVGVGVSAFNRTGICKCLPNYSITAMKNSSEVEILRKDFKIFILEEQPGSNGERKNTLTVLRNSKTKELLDNLDNPHLLFYEPTENIEMLCKENGWNMIGNSTSIFEDDKVKFRRVMEELKLDVIPGGVMIKGTLEYNHLKEEYGKFVIQIADESGGKGTFFIENKNDFEKATKDIDDNSEVLVTKFIEGCSPSLTGCVTKHGILYTNLQHQLLDIHDTMNPVAGSGVFCGHDWTSSNFPEDVNEQAYDYAQKIGEYLKTKGYKGIFGLDLVLDGEKLYVIELNPRLLGSFPVLTMVQEINNEPILMGFHILEFLGKDYDIDITSCTEYMKRPKKGAQLVLFNKLGKTAENKGFLKPGVYVKNGNDIEYARPGYKLEDIKNEDEFIITDGVPFKNTVFKPHARILKVLTIKGIMDTKTLKLNKWTKNIVDKIYEKLEMSEK